MRYSWREINGGHSGPLKRASEAEASWCRGASGSDQTVHIGHHKGLIVPMLWLAVLGQAGEGLAGRRNRETLYNAALLIGIIRQGLKSSHYFEDRHKAGGKCCSAPAPGPVGGLVSAPLLRCFCCGFLRGCCWGCSGSSVCLSKATCLFFISVPQNPGPVRSRERT